MPNTTSNIAHLMRRLLPFLKNEPPRVKKERWIVLSSSVALPKLHSEPGFSFGPNCLYYLGSGRNAVMEDHISVMKWLRDRNIPVELFRAFRLELAQAEKEDRVLWKEMGKPKCQRQLSPFLVRHGYKPMHAGRPDTPLTNENIAMHLKGTNLAAFY